MENNSLKWYSALGIGLLLIATAATVSPIKKHQDGSVTIDTTSLKADEGCFGPTPVILYIDSHDVVSKIEYLPNDETPAYWKMVTDKLLDAWNGVPADKVKDLQVDAVSGATYSSEGLISNVKAGITYYLNAKSE